MKNELEGQIDGDIRYHQKVFDKWKKEYNIERPHEALDMKTPGTIYSASDVEYDPDFVEFQYPANYKNRAVNNRGYVHYKGNVYFVGNPFNGYNIGIQVDKKGQLNVWFGTMILGHFDKDTKLLVPEKEDLLKQRKTKKVLPRS